MFDWLRRLFRRPRKEPKIDLRYNPFCAVEVCSPFHLDRSLAAQIRFEEILLPDYEDAEAKGQCGGECLCAPQTRELLKKLYAQREQEAYAKSFDDS